MKIDLFIKNIICKYILKIYNSHYGLTMLQFQILTEKDRQEAQTLEIKRRAEEERKRRLLNAKSRLIGVCTFEK